MGRGRLAGVASGGGQRVQSPESKVQSRRPFYTQYPGSSIQDPVSTIVTRRASFVTFLRLDRNAPFQPQPESGDGQELRAADAETFFFQRAGRSLSGVSWPGPEDGIR